MQTLYGCYFPNFDYTEWFATEAEMRAYANKSGFEWEYRETCGYADCL
jgi:hypothetical protein